MSKGRGYGQTPVKLVEILKKAVAEKSQYAVAKETGLSLSVIQGLLKGNREPSTSTYHKLSKYFSISIADLRDEGNTLIEQEIKTLVKDIVKIHLEEIPPEAIIMDRVTPVETKNGIMLAMPDILCGVTGRLIFIPLKGNPNIIAYDDPRLSLSVKEIGVPSRVSNVLLNNGMHIMGDLVTRNEAYLLKTIKIPSSPSNLFVSNGLGKIGFNQLKQALSNLGLKLSMKIIDIS